MVQCIYVPGCFAFTGPGLVICGGLRLLPGLLRLPFGVVVAAALLLCEYITSYNQ